MLYSQEYQRKELAQFSNLDKGETATKKKKETGMASAIASTEKIRTWKEHTLEDSALEQALRTRIKEEGSSSYVGITDIEAQNRLKEYGYNILSERKQLPWPIKLLLEFTGLFNYMLWCGAILSYIAFAI